VLTLIGEHFRFKAAFAGLGRVSWASAGDKVVREA
jgi:hypothetical protein